MRRPLKWLPLLLCLSVFAAGFSLAGCGYRFAHDGGDAPVFSGKRIAVPIFANKTYRPNVETVLTENVHHEFTLRTGGRVVPLTDADIVVSGTVTSYATTAVSYSAADKIREYRAELTMEVTVAEKLSRKVLWKGRLSERQEYPVDTDISLQLNRETAAVRDICRRLAQRLYQAVNEDF